MESKRKAPSAREDSLTSTTNEREDVAISGSEFSGGDDTTQGDAGDTGEQSQSTSRGPESTKKHPTLEEINIMAATPVQKWLENLPRDDLQHVGLLLYTNISKRFGLQKTDTTAAVAEFLQKSERTVRRWIDDFVQNDGAFPDTQQGHYVRNNTLMSNEELCEKAREYVRANAAPRGRPNLTAISFCHWVLPFAQLSSGATLPSSSVSGNSTQVAS